MVLENGVEFTRFNAASDQRGVGAVYVGSMDSRFDWAAVAAMAGAAPSVPFRLVGPAQGAPPDLPANVILVGPTPYELVPEILRSAAVGILPLTIERLNESRSPMKFYEYLAAGLHVVASHTPTLAVRSAPGVDLYRDQAGAVRAVTEALAQPERNVAGRTFAASFDWGTRARTLSCFLSELVMRQRGD
jgi:teichuronic acid biosynthesis glycosyltransferase TuaH